MATFKVKIGTSDGELAIRHVHGHSQAEVHENFTREGYYVFSVTRALDLPSLFGLRKGISPAKFIMFNKEFRGLIRAGLPIVEGLDMLLRRMKENRLKSVLLQVRENLSRGESLATAFRSFGDIIPRYYPALLHAGEQSGNLAEVLDRFIDQEERLRKTRKKFLQTLTYPAFLMVVAMVSMYIVLTRAIPEFAGLYRNSGRELPASTQFVMAMSEFLTNWYGELFFGTIFLGLAIFIYLRTDHGGLVGERLLHRIPVVGSIWALQYQNIFSRTMKLLLQGGIPVPEALSTTAGAVPSRLFGSELKQVHDDLVQGDSLHEGLEKHTRLPEMFPEMVRIGEATGTLDEMFDYLAEHGEERSEDYLELVSNAIAPLMLLLVGLVIAFLVVSMYLPMFGSYDAIGR